MRRDIIRRLNNLLSFFRQDKVDKQHGRMWTRRILRQADRVYGRRDRFQRLPPHRRSSCVAAISVMVKALSPQRILARDYQLENLPRASGALGDASTL